MRADIVVVGSGTAGTAAALQAAELARDRGTSLEIRVLEKAPEAEWGGNSRWTTANMRMQDEETLAPNFEADLFEASRGKTDQRLIRAFVEGIPGALRWARSHGVNFEQRPRSFGMIHRVPRIGPNGGGLALISALRDQAERLGVRFFFETTAWKLCLDGEGNVEGVWVRGPEGDSSKILARAVILCCGGFEGNLEMLSRYLGPEAANLRPDVPSTRWNSGDGILMGMELGAQFAGEFGGYHGSIADARPEARRRRPRPVVNCWPYGILVNRLGRRFVDEGMGTISEAFERVSWAIRQQPFNEAFVILDQKFYRIPHHHRTVESPLPPIQADSWEELAERIEVPADSLKETVEAYNRAVQEGEFDPEREDGKRAAGLEPPKSNWALPLDTPPYLCYPVEGTVQFTWGGLATDERARVLSRGGVAIRGLYAAGEITGFYYHAYVGGTSVLRALVFGRIAGQEAAKFVIKNRGEDR